VEHLFVEAANRAVWIEQKYLTMDKGISVRIRGSSCEGIHSYHLTVKKDVGQECIEIETAVSEDDFRKLWLVGFGRVNKMRYLYQGWEVDFFKDKKKVTYLAVAEIELPPNKEWPDSVPKLVQDNIIYTVPIDDKRFSNKKLSNMDYTRALLAEVKSKSKIHKRAATEVPQRTAEVPHKKGRIR
jgi:CYTH domain-containing protein